MQSMEEGQQLDVEQPLSSPFFNCSKMLQALQDSFPFHSFTLSTLPFFPFLPPLPSLPHPPTNHSAQGAPKRKCRLERRLPGLGRRTEKAKNGHGSSGSEVVNDSLFWGVL